MVRCPSCGEATPAGEQCQHCGTSLTDRDGASTAATEDSSSEETSSVSRREMLTYGGGSALLTWAAIGAGWFAFIYEQTGPEEDVVREYVDALDRSHFYTAGQLFHEDAPGEAWTATEIPDVGQLDMSVEDTEVVDRETEVAIDGVQELALVMAEITLDAGVEGETIEVGFVVAQNEAGEWKLWEDR